MKVANTVDLKNRTNKILREVMKGQPVIITYRGKPAASLTPLSEEDLEDFIMENSPKIRKMVSEPVNPSYRNGLRGYQGCERRKSHFARRISENVMTDFQVVLTDHALSDLNGLPSETREQIQDDLKSMAGDPFPSGLKIKRLKGFRPPVYRLRSGQFRILYLIEANTVIVLRIIDRKILERIIKRLKLQKP